MSLDATAMASTMKNLYVQAANLNSDQTAKYEEDEVTSIPPSIPNTFASDFASAYNDYASQGEVAGATNNGADPSGIQSVLNSLSNSPSDITALGNAFATYYSNLALDTGSPAHGGVSVEAVENDGGSKGGDFTSAISGMITTDTVSPPFSSFINAVEGVAKSITWTITEKMGDGSLVDFEENMS